eukprot:scaffold28975_cov18-Tisochrysis_lutea.AAC.1
MGSVAKKIKLRCDASRSLTLPLTWGVKLTADAMIDDAAKYQYDLIAMPQRDQLQSLYATIGSLTGMWRTSFVPGRGLRTPRGSCASFSSHLESTPAGIVQLIDIARKGQFHIADASLISSALSLAGKNRLHIWSSASCTADCRANNGGMPGAERLRDSAVLEALVKDQKEGGRLLAAICATPAVFLEAKGMLAGQKATCHPGFSSKLSDQRW